MAAGRTYTPIATTTLSSSAANVTFSSIPSSYTDIIVVTNGATNVGAQNFRFYVNGDNASGSYSRTGLYGNGTTAGSSTTINSNYAYAADAAITQSPNILQLMSYSNTSIYKTILTKGGSANDEAIIRVVLWRNTAAINSITLETDANTWAAGTTFTLYGIAAA